MKIVKKIVIFTVLLVLIGGGGFIASPYGLDLLELKKDPATIATRFWDAALSSNPKDADKYRIAQPGLELGIAGYHPDDSFTIGEPIQSDYAWFIDTSLRLIRDGRVIVIPIQTVIAPEGEDWKVDYWSTKNSIFDASINSVVSWYTGTISGATTIFGDLAAADEDTAKSQVKALEDRLDTEFKQIKQQLVSEYQRALEQKDAANKRLESRNTAAAALGS